MPNKGMLVNFPLKLVAMATSLEWLVKGQVPVYDQILLYCEKIVKIAPVDPDIIGLKESFKK